MIKKLWSYDKNNEEEMIKNEEEIIKNEEEMIKND